MSEYALNIEVKNVYPYAPRLNANRYATTTYNIQIYTTGSVSIRVSFIRRDDLRVISSKEVFRLVEGKPLPDYMILMWSHVLNTPPGEDAYTPFYDRLIDGIIQCIKMFNTPEPTRARFSDDGLVKLISTSKTLKPVKTRSPTPFVSPIDILLKTTPRSTTRKWKEVSTFPEPIQSVVIYTPPSIILPMDPCGNTDQLLHPCGNI
jgi:hypothetical protein